MADDTISRKAAIEAIDEYDFEFPNYMERFVTELRDAMKADLKNDIEALPSAQPEQRWIPCSKRLPPELKPVNVTWINREPPTYYEKLKNKPFADTAVIYEGKWYWQSAVCVDLLKEYGESPADDVADAIEIVAWTPLPEPYGGESDES